MRQGKQISTKQRGLRMIAYMLMGAVVGGFVGYFAMLYHLDGLPSFMSLDHLVLFTRVFNFIAFVIAIYLGIKANQLHTSYKHLTDEEDDLVDDLYGKMYRNLEYATISFNVAVSLTLLNLGLGTRIDFSSSAISMTWSFIDLLLLVLLFISQPLILKLTQKIRQYRLSALATVKEMKDFANSMDEGEKQANYEMSFQIVFSLNQIILPSLYIFLFVLSFILHRSQIVGYIIVAFLHIYINVMQVQMVRRYFK